MFLKVSLFPSIVTEEEVSYTGGTRMNPEEHRHVKKTYSIGSMVSVNVHRIIIDKDSRAEALSEIKAIKALNIKLGTVVYTPHVLTKASEDEFLQEKVLDLFEGQDQFFKPIGYNDGMPRFANHYVFGLNVASETCLAVESVAHSTLTTEKVDGIDLDFQGRIEQLSSETADDILMAAMLLEEYLGDRLDPREGRSVESLF